MMLSPAERDALRQEWLAKIEAEIKRRQAAKFEAAGDDPRASLTAKLEEISQRMRAAPDWVEPTPDKQAQSARGSGLR